ncbi:hypothetical protein BDZ89DRAFT_1081630 [Hymenopellis radicata]|nr:hypothetical protein BDZ89DRAFT_1081630 [Hymenopellis radicata]
MLRRYASTVARHPRVSSRLVPSPATENWLTRKVRKSKNWAAFFNATIFLLGYKSTFQTAGARNYHLYTHACARAPERNIDFWVNECHLPRTFQSYFLVANIHVWLLAARLRALPHTAHVQTLIDHFFLDIEDRIRMIVRPPAYPAPKTNKAPETLVTRQMKVFRDQWQGMWLSLDYALVAGDEHLAAALWRNLLGARGAHGINPPPTASDPFPEKKKGASLASEGAPPAPIPFSSYPAFPELSLALTRYVRRELKRLQNIPDSVFLDDDVPTMCRQTDAEKSQARDLLFLYEPLPPKPEDKYTKLDIESDLEVFGAAVKKPQLIRAETFVRLHRLKGIDDIAEYFRTGDLMAITFLDQEVAAAKRGDEEAIATLETLRITAADVAAALKTVKERRKGNKK